MGLYDREYYQEERRGFGMGGSSPASAMTITTRLVILNVVIYIFGMFLEDKTLLVRWFGAGPHTLVAPWRWYQFLTYGFIHDPRGAEHLIFNMIGLWFFGRPVEQRLGRREFLVFYLATIVFGGLVTSLRAYLFATNTVAIGASGAITGIVLLFACYFPRAQVLFMLFIPMPAWLLGVILVVMNVLGQFGGGEGGVAYDVHLAGAAMAAGYYFGNWRLSRWLPSKAPGKWRNPLKRRPDLRVHRPTKDENLAREADRILDKLNREGIDALTAKERKILEKYSREVRRRGQR